MSSSSRSKHRSKRTSSSSSSSSYYPTQWSKWEWDVDRADFKRYRLASPGEYEFQYEKESLAAADPAEPRTPQASLDPIQEGSYSSSANYTISSVPTVETITRGVAQTTLSASITSVPSRNQTPAGTSDLTHITTINPYTDKEEFDPHYKVHKAFEFKRGRVFKVLWSEPQGTPGPRGDGSSNAETYTERENKFGEKTFSKVRRFVIIRPLSGHCICLPINTYSRKGVTKNGVHAGDHTIAYSSGNKPVYFKGEKAKGLTRKPLKIVTKNPRHKLADESRLNYAKTYTVEYNVKVWFIGQVDKDSEWHLVTDFNQVHPPLGTQGLSEPSPYEDGETSYAEGGMEEQSSTYVTPLASYGTGKTSWASSSHANESQSWQPQQQYYSESHDQPQTSSYYPAAAAYPSSHSDSYSESRPSRSRGKGKAIQRDAVPEADIPEGEEQEHVYENRSYEHSHSQYDSHHGTYDEPGHVEQEHKYGPVSHSEVIEDLPHEPEVHEDVAEYDTHAAYEHPAEAEEYVDPHLHDEYEKPHEDARYAEDSEEE